MRQTITLLLARPDDKPVTFDECDREPVFSPASGRLGQTNIRPPAIKPLTTFGAMTRCLTALHSSAGSLFSL